MKPYPRDFAHLYDFLVYGREEVEAKEKELGFIRWALDDVCPREVNHILDIGCGNGRFLIPLARAGYMVVGLDNSRDMLEECRRRLRKHRLQGSLIQGDLETLAFDQHYDALLCMDSVLCYLLETERIIAALQRFRRALRPQGLLILDNWNMLAQWKTLGKTRSYVKGNERIRIDHQERTWYDNFASIFHIETVAKVLEGGRSYEFRHEELLRANTVGEMKMYLKEAGFTQVAAYPSYDLAEAANVNGENMIFLATRL